MRLQFSMLLPMLWLTVQASAGQIYSKQPDWVETMLAGRKALKAERLDQARQDGVAHEVWFRMKEDYPVEWDWTLQDGGQDFWRWYTLSSDADLERTMIAKVGAELGESGQAFNENLRELVDGQVPVGDRRWLGLYQKACVARRLHRLRTMMAKTPRIVFIRHHTIRPSFFAYTEGQSDAQNERHFLPGAELCLLELGDLRGKVRVLLADPAGAIRDPAVSWDGQRVLFAWKKSLDEDDYHLHELNVLSNEVRQVTSGLGFADYEPAYLPNDDIIFASTRCVQTVDCWWTEVSNLYTCDPEGRYLRRLGFDQVHTVFPQVADDGRVIYTRWDYNDRGQIFPQPLFQMYPDGTGQTEYYGNNSWFPTTIAHARGIPGTEKVLAILCGHHSTQAGKLAIIDPNAGRQENSGVQLVAPVRETPAERIDGYGQEGELWQYPYPLNDRECLTGYAPLGWDQPAQRRGDADFGVYWMDIDGHRELLAWDARLPSTQPVPLAERLRPFPWANRVDYTQPNGVYYVQDVYEGPGLAGVPRGTIKKLRVVGLEFRAAGIGNNGSRGPGGGALVCTPISVGNGSWDVKVVLGEAKVYEDGSALFKAPARTPLYFQAVDGQGRVVQTMRSWSTLQPGEFFGCGGCHEHKNMAPPLLEAGFAQAMKAGAQDLEPFYGPPRGFSFIKEIQPILDRHCVRCHKDRQPIGTLKRGNPDAVLATTASARARSPANDDELAFSLLGTENEDRTAKRKWSDSYLALTRAHPSEDNESAGAFWGDCQGRVVNWISSQSVPEALPPYSAGSVKSELMLSLESGHKGVKLSREELDKIACWIDLLVPYCGDYAEANAWTEEELKKYDHFATKRLRMQEIEQDNLRDLLRSKEPKRRGGPMGSMGRRRF
jgi:hypothetical protein